TQHSSKDYNKNLHRHGWHWDSESFEHALSILIPKLDLKGCSASALCLPASVVSFRTLKLPFDTETKIRQILPFELTSHLPKSHADYLSDFIILNATSVREHISDIGNILGKSSLSDRTNLSGRSQFSGKSNISEMSMGNFLGKSKLTDKSNLSDRSNIADKSNLSDRNNLPDKSNLSGKTTSYENGLENLSITNHNYIFTASLPVAVMDICFSVLKKYGIEPELVTSQGIAAAICIENGVLIEMTQANTVISVICHKNVIAVRSFAGNKDVVFIEKAVHQTLAGLFQRYGMEIASITCYLVLDYACSDKIDVSDFKGYNVQRINFADYIDTGSPVDLSDDIHGNWFNAMAATLCYAMQKTTINFCQGSYAKNSFFHKFKDNLVLPAIFACITIVVLFVTIQYDISLLKEQVITLDKKIIQTFSRTFPDVKTFVEPLMQMQVKVRDAEKQSGFVAGEQGRVDSVNIRVVDILYELSNRISDNVDVDLTRLMLSEGRVVMAGTTDNFNTVDKIKTLIEKYNRFKSVTISSANADKNGNRVAFNFVIELK
ncbi:MAG: PilN domain-containing protein, partial [Desulfamplus sp.]|nr:PilN domain-containing protein [Desulfamplus sp.]